MRKTHDFSPGFKLDEWVKSSIENSYLCIFKDISSAYDFIINEGGDFALFEIEAKGVRQPYVYRAVPDNYNIRCYWDHVNYVRRKHKKINLHLSLAFNYKWPLGTLFCKEYKLIKGVQL